MADESQNPSAEPGHGAPSRETSWDRSRPSTAKPPPHESSREQELLAGLSELLDQGLEVQGWMARLGSVRDRAAAETLTLEYEGRLRELDELAAPALEELHGILAVLEAPREELFRQQKESRSEKALLEARCKVGQIDKSTVSVRLDQLDAELKRVGRELKPIDQRIERLRNAIRAFEENLVPDSKDSEPDSAGTAKKIETDQTPEPPPPPKEEPRPPTHDETVVLPPAVLIDMASGTPYPLAHATYIGSEDAHVILDDVAVSRQHAEIRYEPERGFVIRDCGSRFGTFVNEERVTEHTLTSGDKVRCGGVTLSFRID